MANERRLIDANALFKRLQNRREDFADGWKTLDAMPINAQIQYHENLECALIAEDLPIVDAVEVVRCKDCKYWMYDYDDVGLCLTDVPDIDVPVIDGVQRLAQDFCSYGERRTDG